jgi:hypothetical protein
LNFWNYDNENRKKNKLWDKIEKLMIMLSGLFVNCSATNSWQAQFGCFGSLKLFSIFGVHGKLKVHVPKSRTAACQQIVSGKLMPVHSDK